MGGEEKTRGRAEGLGRECEEGSKGAEEAGDRWNLLTGIGWNGEEGWGGRMG